MIVDADLIAKLDALTLRDPGNLQTVFSGRVVGMELVSDREQAPVYYAVVRIEQTRRTVRRGTRRIEE